MKEINSDNRILYWEYHKYCIARLPEYEEVYSILFTDDNTGNKLDEFKRKHEEWEWDWDMEFQFGPNKRHNFATSKDYQDYLANFMNTRMNFILNIYKSRRKEVVKFLLDSEINRVNLIDISQDHIDRYSSNIINNMNANKIDKHLESIRKFISFHRKKINKEVKAHRYDAIRSVPVWDVTPPNKEQATKEQLKFYNYWLSNYENNKIIRVNGVLQYLFLYLYDVIAEFMITREIDKLDREFEKMFKNYGHYKSIKRYLYFWWMDAYRLILNEKKYLEYKIRHDAVAYEGMYGSADIGNIIDKIKVSNNPGIIVEAFYLVMRNKESLTQYALDNLEELIRSAIIYIEGIVSGNREDVEEYTLNQLKYRKDRLSRTYNDQVSLFKYVPPKYLNEDRVFVYRKKPAVVCELPESKQREIIREIENAFRDRKNIPRVGEGWISETILYKQLKKSFPKERVVQHGKPKWLGRQHLDIYFPGINIGIEYQGIQHDEPIEYFGGVEAFEKIQELDMRKKRLCESNNCELIYVYPEYNLEEIKNQIEALILSKKAKNQIEDSISRGE